MNNAPVNQTLASIARLIAESNDFTLIMHVSPDGDSIGSACALRLALMAMGKRVQAVCDGDVPRIYRFLEGAEDIIKPNDARITSAAIAVDCADEGRMGAADMAAEALIQSFEMDSFRHRREEEQREALTQVRRETEGLSAERIYRWLASGNRKSDEVHQLGDLFRVEDHGLWYSAKSNFMKPEDVQDSEESKDENPTELLRETDVPDWDRIAQMVKISLETENRGAERGELLTALNARTEKHMDYSTFLRKFTLFRENLKVDDSAFDYIFYTYGLELYGDMPLVEPLEYADERTISDFVIVIDTSASTQGKLVERFVQRTFDLLQESREIKNRFNIHLIQCDAAVQEDRILRTREDVHRYLENMELKGLGGTDYRPAFHYINNLVERGEFRHLQGVLYFTDGKGIFPRRKPPYDTAFIFEDDAAASEAKVPSWGMKVVFGGKDEY